MSDPNNHLTQKYKQFQELLEKTENRAERLKILNDQTKKLLDSEKERNNQMQQENSALKQQVFQTHKDLRELQELFEEQKSKIEHLQNELSKNTDMKTCQKCVQLALKRANNNLKQGQISPHLSQNMISSIYSQNGNKNNGNIFQFKTNQELSPNNYESQQSSGSSSQQISDEEKNNLQNQKQKNVQVSVRFNNGKGVDYIKTMSKSIVAIKYEGDYQEDSQSESQDLSNNNDLKLTDIQFINNNIKELTSVQNSDIQQDQQQEQQDFIVQVNEQNNKDIQNQKDLNTSQDLIQTLKKKSSSKNSSQLKSQAIIKFNKVNSKKNSTIRFTKENIEDTTPVSYSKIKSIVIPSLNDFKEQINNSYNLIQDKPNQIQKQVNFAQQIEEIKISNQGTLNQITEEGLQSIINCDVSDTNSNANNNSNNININKNENMSDIDSNNFNSANFNSVNYNSDNFNSKESDIKNNTDENHKNSNNRLFEKFFILGCEKEDMNEFDQDNSVTQAHLPGKILYSYPEINQQVHQDQVLKVIHEFAFPKGIKSKKIKISSSFRKIRKQQ